ncbi:MAG: lysylphosphatidylglycerol synthase transmembrane domain-containing protein [Acidobacteriota bacterium]|nr:lysylphosphatidylglycerol synthase transmembrane domain-containing protein [Acidobacteriota bacterium]
MPRKVWFGLFQTLVTVTLLWAIAQQMDWAAMGRIVSAISPSFYLYSLAILASGQACYACRWYVVLRGLGIAIPLRRVVRYHLIGMLFTSVLPTAMGGDGARLFYVGREQGYADAGASVVVDRLLGLLSFVVVATALSWWLQGGDWDRRDIRSTLALLCAGGAFGLACVLVMPLDRWLDGVWSPTGRIGQAIDVALQVVTRTRQVVRSPLVLGGALGLTLLNLVLVAAIYQMFLVAADGVAPTVGELVLVLTLVSVFVNIPVSLNGIGLREQLHIWLLGSVGVSTEAAVGVSVVMLLQLMAFSLIGLAVWVSTGRRGNHPAEIGGALTAADGVEPAVRTPNPLQR